MKKGGKYWKKAQIWKETFWGVLAFCGKVEESLRMTLFIFPLRLFSKILAPLRHFHQNDF
jgi:hypothetical protein